MMEEALVRSSKLVQEALDFSGSVVRILGIEDEGMVDAAAIALSSEIVDLIEGFVERHSQ